MDQREWLETNGIGGYASSTVCGINTRRYHGLLVAATNPPVGRVVLLSKLDERISIGTNTIDLGANQFPGTVHPRGFQYLRSFERSLFPVFEYVAGSVRIRKTIAAIHGENTTVIVYELIESAEDVTLELRPFIAGRDYHSLVHANDAIHRDASFDASSRSSLTTDCRHFFLAFRAQRFIRRPTGISDLSTRSSRSAGSRRTKISSRRERFLA
jgi:predicted glycogen debranching enzyme